MEKVIKKVSLYERKNDRQFWLKKSYLERLAALENIRKEYHQWQYNAEPKFQRVYTISRH
ncbi:hypothetical protein [Picosynechococcus sp. PCC 73109]|uniref:hypothetical protein n=1 Tax=Picosynechococcus sp. PCC 73109 TaxID=374982 RepID=UPI000745899E|nr:hypothetical protein [Picosynechococcus sp. PCC 73109]AMA07852.1 hypothetical protein AWQ23_00140 [Picosynechococcus sp. PCC 73109]